MALLKLTNITKIYNTNNLLSIGIKNVNLTFNSNEFVLITGQSGSGKSTLLNVLGANDSYEEGELYFNNNKTSHFTKDEWDKYREENISFIFQDFNIIENLTVYENINLALLGIKDKVLRKKRVLALIDKVGLRHYAHKKTAFLSGGEKQRCVIARALAKDSKIILCDEPTGNLDSKNSHEIASLLHTIAHDKLVIVVSHNKEYFTQYATREIIIFDGGVKEDKTLANNIVPPLIQEPIPPKNTPPLKQAFYLALLNYKSRPRFAFSLTLAILLAIFALFFIYLVLKNNYLASLTNNLEKDTRKGKVVLIRKDNQPFSYHEINNLKQNIKKEVLINNAFVGYEIRFAKKDFLPVLSQDLVITTKYDPFLKLNANTCLLSCPYNMRREANFIKEYLIKTTNIMPNIKIKYSYYTTDILLYLNKNILENNFAIIKALNSQLMVENRTFNLASFKVNANLNDGEINLINSNIFDILGKEIILSLNNKKSFTVKDDTKKNATKLLTVELSTNDYNFIFAPQQKAKSIALYFNDGREANFYLKFLNNNYLGIITNYPTFSNNVSNKFINNTLVYLAIIIITITLSLIITFIFVKSIKVFSNDFIIYKTLGITKKISNLSIYFLLLFIYLPTLVIIPLISFILAIIPGLSLSAISFYEYLIIEVIALIIILNVSYNFCQIINKVKIIDGLKKGSK